MEIRCEEVARGDVACFVTDGQREESAVDEDADFAVGHRLRAHYDLVHFRVRVA